MTDWLRVCRDAVEDVRGVLVELPTRDEREPVVGDGEGGDETTAIDAAAEKVILERLEGIEGTTIVSEEAGILGDGPTRIVVDPIDGSLNAKRGIPFFSVSIAVAEGDTMDDVVFGYVYDFGSGEEWVAERGNGALLNGGDLGLAGVDGAHRLLPVRCVADAVMSEPVDELDVELVAVERELEAAVPIEHRRCAVGRHLVERLARIAGELFGR